jgi:hypothetical protein
MPIRRIFRPATTSHIRLTHWARWRSRRQSACRGQSRAMIGCAAKLRRNQLVAGPLGRSGRSRRRKNLAHPLRRLSLTILTPDAGWSDAWSSDSLIFRPDVAAPKPRSTTEEMGGVEQPAATPHTSLREHSADAYNALYQTHPLTSAYSPRTRERQLVPGMLGVGRPFRSSDG